MSSGRVLGPTFLPSRQARGVSPWRVLVIAPGEAGEDGGRSTRWFTDEATAQDYRDEVAARLARLDRTTIGQAIRGFREHLIEKGTGSISYDETTRRLRAFFPDHGLRVARVTPELAEELYIAFRRRLYNGKPISVSYHRAALINARSLFKWCVRSGYVSANPFATVEGIGKRRRGKAQWTGDEARRFYAYALPLAEAGNVNALACLMSLLMALRSKDLRIRVVRDVDLEGSVLRVYGGKTEASNRPRHVPEVLRPMLVELAAGRDPFEPLFKTPYTDNGFHTRRWLEQALEKLAKAAGVPPIVPHALKGVAGTLLATTGELSERIRDHLSHEDKATTEQHYVRRGALEEAAARRGMKVITGGKR